MAERKYDYTRFGEECALFQVRHKTSFKKMAQAAGVKESSFQEARTSDRGYEDLRRTMRDYMARAEAAAQRGGA